MHSSTSRLSLRNSFQPQLALLVGLSALSLALTGCAGDASADEIGPGTAADPTVLTVDVMELGSPSRLTMTRSYRGQVEARRSSDLGFDTAGTLVQVRVDEGDQVRRGTLLARLDTDRVEARRKQLDAAVAERRTGLELAESTLERLERAAERSAVSPQDVDEAMRARDAAASALARTEAELELIDVETDKTRLLAPYAAVVAQRHLDEGQVVSPGMAVLSILEVDKPRARIGLPTSLIESLTGDQFTVRVGDRLFDATRVSAGPRQDPRSRTVDLLLELDAKIGSGGTSLLAGETAVLQVQRSSQSEGFAVPMAALTESTRGLWSLLVAAPTGERDGLYEIEQRAVEVLEIDSDSTPPMALVRGLLRIGDLVVDDGLQRVVSGQTVRVTPIDTRSDRGATVSEEAQL